MTNTGMPTATPPSTHPPSSLKVSGTTLDPAAWEEAPPFLLNDPNKPERVAIRNANHVTYQSIGTVSIWRKYIQLGYYVFDDCMDFQRVWRSTSKEAISNRYKVIWKSYHIHRMNDIPIGPILQKSVTTTVLPYLKAKDPDYILATDMEYEEKRFFETLTDSTEADVDAGWTEVSPKNKHRKKSPNPKSPDSTPRSISPNSNTLHSPTLSVLTDESNKHTTLSTARRTPLPSDDDSPMQSDSPVILDNNSPTQPAIHIHNPYKKTKPNTQPPFRPTINPTVINLTTDNTVEHTTTQQDDDTNTIITHNTSDTSTTNHLPAGQSNTTKSVGSTTMKHDHTQINDGSLRVTVRWRPENYDDISDDEVIWNEYATTMLKDIFNHPSKIRFVPWTDTITNANMVNADQITTNALSGLRAPKISFLESRSMCIFGIRICATDKIFSSGSWLKNANIKAALEKHRVELTISNSTCDSGPMMVAGTIFLKHPVYTHRLYFLLALRRSLPSNTPYFDIAVHRRTPTGIDCPHLVVKCGEQHQDALTEILSDFLDGKQTTALFIGTKLLQSMTLEVTHNLFDTHQKYVDSIQRLPLFPQIVNIDRLRDESHEIIRTTRGWANSLTTPEGKSLQCDAENGDRDRKAYLLVPQPLVNAVRPLLQKYQHQLRSITRHMQDGTLLNSKDCPHEIYIPTASVQRNLDFLQSMSSADIWRNAPSTIKTKGTPTQPPQVAKQSNHTNTHSTTMTPIRTRAPAFDMVNSQTPLTTNAASQNTPHLPSPPRHTHQSTLGHHHTAPARAGDDQTTATFHSTSTTLNSSHATKFNELEASIKASQLEFRNIHSKFETMETRMLQTMNVCNDNTRQMVTLQNQLHSLQSSIQLIADQMQTITHHLTETDRVSIRSPVKKKHCHREDAESADNHDPSKQSPTILWAASSDNPPAKENQQDTPSTTFNTSRTETQQEADQAASQYTEASAPGTAMEE
jgi:hypothetical protein